MKFKVGDRIRFDGYEGTIIEIIERNGIDRHKINWDYELFGPSIVSGNQIKLLERICEECNNRQLYNERQGKYFCPFCEGRE